VNSTRARMATGTASFSVIFLRLLIPHPESIFFDLVLTPRRQFCPPTFDAHSNCRPRIARELVSNDGFQREIHREFQMNA
jgi:hypothetical protein